MLTTYKLTINMADKQSATTLADYYAKYYPESGERPGSWYGGGAEALKLTGQKVTSEALKNLFLGKTPDGKSQLVRVRISKPKAAPQEGERIEKGRKDEKEPELHVPGFDLTFSPPKSVTALWAVSDDPTRKIIEQCFHDAASYLPFCERELSMTTPNPDFINFGGVLIPEQDSQAHFAFTGTTGSGKTLLMRLLQQSTLCHIGAGLGYRAIVYDAKQDALPLLAAYCDRSRLFTLNPFDDRGVAWDIAADVTEPRVALEMAFTLIPEASESQPYFANASRNLMYGVMLSFMLRGLDWTLADVLRALSTPNRCRKVLEQHRHTVGIVEHYFSEERLLNDVFSTMATKMLLYQSIAGCWDAAKERISLKTWSTEEMILILGNTEISRIAIDNINRCIFKRASDLILSKSEGTTDRSWFYIDEVSEAGRLPISSLLKKGRSKGGRVAIAYQSISGLRDPKLFGQHQTDDILGQIGNRFFGLIECPETAEYAARVIGDSEIQQMSKSVTSSKQGSSTTKNTAPVVRRAVLPSEFMSIPPCDFTNGLTGLFTTRSGDPAWDWMSPADLCDALISPADDVDDFVPRDPNFQLVEPWTADEEKEFTPGLQQNNRKKKSRNPDIDPSNSPTEKRLDVDDFNL